MDPTAELDLLLPDGTVAEKLFVERLEPASQHSQEVLDEDDAFLAMATPEVWEYDIVDGSQGEFEAAMRASEVVFEFEVIDEDETEPGDATGAPLKDGDAYAPEGTAERQEVTRGGSGARGVDDGPAGRATGNPSAGGSSPGKPYFGVNDALGIEDAGDGGLDDLTVTEATDPSLGLTNRGRKRPQDWAANTGPTREADRGVETDYATDKASTLGPDKTTRRR
ncbi:MAG: hypothetical protein KIT09_08130 [Bryobacteraceae bacterium]|nr:hypothetical protein [Bryobacteraceae bacterium]